MGGTQAAGQAPPMIEVLRGPVARATHFYLEEMPPRCQPLGQRVQGPAARIVLGPDVTICESCVEICEAILARGRAAADISILEEWRQAVNSASPCLSAPLHCCFFILMRSAVTRSGASSKPQTQVLRPLAGVTSRGVNQDAGLGVSILVARKDVSAANGRSGRSLSLGSINWVPGILRRRERGDASAARVVGWPGPLRRSLFRLRLHPGSYLGLYAWPLVVGGIDA